MKLKNYLLPAALNLKLKLFFRRRDRLIPSFFVVLLTTFTSFAEPQISTDYIQKVERLQLWNNIQWTKLLHYEPSWLHKVKSRADGEHFFTHPHGKYDSESEMKEFILRLLAKEEINDQHPRCLFPARIKWLKEKIGLPDFVSDFSKCEKYLKFRKAHNTKKVYVVFSSYYLESPASTFGHTLIRLGKDEKIKSNKYNELLDTAINYGANYTTDNPILYSLLGVVGGFKGSFSSLPYFYKIREYNDFESRDLWSYELKLTDQQIDKFLDHLWEMGNTYFYYYYFDENCSYYLLTLLETVNPEWNLTDSLPPYVIPVDTLKAINETPGLVGSLTYRPSIRKKANTYVNQLSLSEKKTFEEVLRSKDLSLIEKRHSSAKEKAFIADALATYLDLQFPQEILNEKGKNYQWKMQLLKKRSQIDDPGILVETPLPEREIPHAGHDTGRMQLSYSYHNELRGSQTLGYRFALHDLLDPVQGHSKTSSIEFMHTKLRYYDFLGKFRLEKFSLVGISNLNPWTRMQSPTSVQLNFGLKMADEVVCTLCTVSNLDFSFGTSHYLTKNENLMVSFLIANEFTYSPQYSRKDFEFGVGPTLKLYYWMGDWATTELSGSYLRFVNYGEYQSLFKHETRLHIHKNYDIFITNLSKRFGHEHSIGLSIFH